MVIPPIKSQGIKSKLVPCIIDLVKSTGLDLSSVNWFEPFFGTGVVGFNVPVGGKYIVGDSNPHILNFYNGILRGDITSSNVRSYLEYEGNLLSLSDEDGYAHYRKIRDRFNKEYNPFDFLFLSRSCFNGMMRFNKLGKWNVPFCKKPNRFSRSYITKICNQVMGVENIISSGSWSFHHQDFIDTIKCAKRGDIIYCDPPYFGRYADYYNGWTYEDEERLFNALQETDAYFILSTWHHNEFRHNEMIDRFWEKFNIKTQGHFYHNGGRIENRRSMVEALVYNFPNKP
jgi:modification methylase ecoRV